MKSFSIRRALILIVVVVLAIGLLLLPFVLSTRFLDPEFALDDSRGGTYYIVCNSNVCIVSDIRHDGAIMSFRVTGPMSYRQLVLNYSGCVSKENFELVTYEITNTGKGLFGGRIAHIGTPYCIEIATTD